MRGCEPFQQSLSAEAVLQHEIVHRGKEAIEAGRSWSHLRSEHVTVDEVTFTKEQSFDHESEFFALVSPIR